MGGTEVVQQYATELRYIYVTTYIATANRVYPFSYTPHSNISIIEISLTMHTFFLFVAYLSATLATPVAQLFDFFEDDTAATINNNQGIKILPQDFGTGEPEDLSTGLQQVGGNDAPSFLTGSATINYLQAQVPSQDTFSNSGGGCPSGELFCCRGGSGPAGSLFTDDAFNDKCIPCMSYYSTYPPKAAHPHCLANKPCHRKTLK